jgi:hypothetical protein
MMRLKLLWDEYAAHVVAPQMPPQVQVELRRAFYFGTTNVLKLIAETPETATDEECDRLMHELLAELDQFKQDILAGRV